MFLRPQKFDFKVTYRKGIEMHMADPLSLAYLPLVKQEEDMWGVADERSPTEIKTEYVTMPEFVPIRQMTLCDIKSETELDADLSVLVTMIKQGWPDIARRMCPPSCRSISLSEESCHYRTELYSRVNKLWFHLPCRIALSTRFMLVTWAFRDVLEELETLFSGLA